MILVRVSLLSAITGKETQLGVMTVANDGTSRNPRVGHYDSRVDNDIPADEPVDFYGVVLRKPDFKQETRRGRLEKHRRLDLTIWHLIGGMLKNMGYTK